MKRHIVFSCLVSMSACRPLREIGSHLDLPQPSLSFMLRCPCLVACNSKAAQDESYNLAPNLKLVHATCVGNTFNFNNRLPKSLGKRPWSFPMHFDKLTSYTCTAVFDQIYLTNQFIFEGFWSSVNDSERLPTEKRFNLKRSIVGKFSILTVNSTKIRNISSSVHCSHLFISTK